MKCPQCESELRVCDRHGVEIDLCPACRGVWLDRGELDKIVERASRFRELPLSDDDHEDAPHRGSVGPRRGGFWRDLFD